MLNLSVWGQIFIYTNTLGLFDEVNDAVRERFRVIYFPYKFVLPSSPNYNPEDPFQKPMIENVLDNFIDLPVKMINLMIHYYYKGEVAKPMSIKRKEEELICEVDDVAGFLDKKCKFKAGKNIEGRHLWTAYKEDGGTLSFPHFKSRMKNKGFDYKRVKVDGQSLYGFGGIFLDIEEPDDIE